MIIAPGDILAIRGPAGFPSDEICRLTSGNSTRPVSHIGVIIGCNPNIVIEALTRVRTRPLHLSIDESRAAYVLHALTLSDVQRTIIVEKACSFTAEGYGYADIVWQGLDAELRTHWWTEHFATDHPPICSLIGEASYEAVGLTFGVQSRDATPQNLLNYAEAWPSKYLLQQIK